MTEWRDDGEHTHAQHTPFLVWATFVGMLLLAGCVTVLSIFLAGRVTLNEHRNRVTTTNAQHDRQAICSVLLSIPPKHRSPAIRQALQIDKCHSLRLPPVAPPRVQTSPSGSRPATGSTPTVSGAAPASTTTVHRTSKPRPQPTATKTVRPAPSPPPTPTPRPSPSATCLNLPKPLPKICR